MSLFKLERIGRTSPGLNYGLVVRAKDEEEARRLAANLLAELSVRERDIWSNPAFSKCKPIDPEGPAEVIIQDTRDSED
jgi:hypothetical protein